MRIDDVSRASASEQLADLPPAGRAQGLFADAREHARQICLPGTIAPYLADDRRTHSQRCSLPLKHPQLGADLSIAAIDGHERTSVEDCLHAASVRGACPSRDAASSRPTAQRKPLWYRA